MRVLVACEFSGRVRDAFIRRGHDAWSCDLLPSEAPGPHIEGDILPILGQGWDLMIAHPPCTYLCRSGARWWRGREADQAKAYDFFMALVNAPIPRIAVENPIGIMSTRYRKPDQIVQPWWFGCGETKATCLWLKNLPPLQKTSPVSGRLPRIHFLGPTKDRGKLRSITYLCIAEAMASQWSNL